LLTVPAGLTRQEVQIRLEQHLDRVWARCLHGPPPLVPPEQAAAEAVLTMMEAAAARRRELLSPRAGRRSELRAPSPWAATALWHHGPLLPGAAAPCRATAQGGPWPAHVRSAPPCRPGCRPASPTPCAGRPGAGAWRHLLARGRPRDA
jgi:hypothetical protein